MTNTKETSRRLDDRATESLARAAESLQPILSRPQPGQLLIWIDSAQPIQWLVLAARALPQRAIKLVPVDAFGLRGTTDLAVKETLTGAELSSRGEHSLWVALENLPHARRCGEVAPEDLRAIREQLEHPTPSFSSLDVDDAADYVEWIEGVVRPAVHELEELIHAVGVASQQPLPSRGNQRWPRAAAALLLLAVGFVAGRLSQTSNESR